MIAPVEQRLLTTNEAAAYMKVRRSSFYKYKDLWGIKSYKLDGMNTRPVLYRIEELDDAIWRLKQGKGTFPAHARERLRKGTKAKAKQSK